MSAFHASTTSYAWPEPISAAPAQIIPQSRQRLIRRPRNVLAWGFVGAGVMMLALDGLVWWLLTG